MCLVEQKNPVSLMGICVLYRRDPDAGLPPAKTLKPGISSVLALVSHPWFAARCSGVVRLRIDSGADKRQIFVYGTNRELRPEPSHLTSWPDEQVDPQECHDQSGHGSNRDWVGKPRTFTTQLHPWVWISEIVCFVSCDKNFK
jgi:hypothetical protein